MATTGKASATVRRRRPAGRPVTRVDGYAPIGEYAAIGDGRTIALVARDGSIDWLPLPTIDQAAALGALLDAERGGSFRLAPEAEYVARRQYVRGTNVLQTTFTTDGGVLRVTDALDLQDGGILPWVELARRVECLSGRVRLRWSIEPRFGYGEEATEVTEIGGRPVALGKRLRRGSRLGGRHARALELLRRRHGGAGRGGQRPRSLRRDRPRADPLADP